MAKKGENVPYEKKMELRVDRVMRTVHLYTGLFLLPWVLVYAISAFLLNHSTWIAENFGLAFADWEMVKELDYPEKYDINKTLEAKAREVLIFAGLDGPHQILDGSSSREFGISRQHPSGEYLITWIPSESRLIIDQKRPFFLSELVHFLHFSHGYDQPYFSSISWAVMVDLFLISLFFWMISGVYIWALRKKKRFLGTLSLTLGVALFSGIVIIMFQ